MKFVWLSCIVMTFGMLTGCSTSTVDTAGDASDATVISDPEWAKSDQSVPDVTVAMKVQPIPEFDDDHAPADELASPRVKPIPEDDK